MGKTYTVTEAAAEKGVHVQSIRDAIRDDRLKARKAGGVWLIEEKDLKKYTPSGNKPFSKTEKPEK